MTTTLRRVTADEWRTWRPVRLAALADAADAFGSRLEDWVDAPEDRWRSRLSIPGALDLLAYEGDRAVGMATGVPGQRSRAGVISVWVAPDRRGRGVATALIDRIAGWAADEGFVALVLSVMPDNTGARAAYERVGFVPSAERGHPLPGGRHELVMVRDLQAVRPTPG